MINYRMGVFSMKSKLILLISLLFVLTFLGCEQTEDVKNNPNKADLKSFIDSVDLPYNFSIEFDPEEVKTVDSAKIYSAAYLDFDHDVVIDTLLEGEVTATENYAEGIQYQAETENQTEYLWIYDGGESFGIESAVNGGISYGVHLDEDFLFSKQFTVIENTPGPPDNITQEYGYDLKGNYKSFVDLDFMPYEHALTEVESILATLGFPTIEVADTYSLDLETMTHHYDIYLEADGSKDSFNWYKEDEAYLFFFRQTIDDIPLTNKLWPSAAITHSEAFAYTSLNVIYAGDSKIDLRANNFLEIGDMISEESLLSGADALDQLIDHYSEVLLSNKTKLSSMELSYVAIYKSNEKYELIPAWVFEVAEAYETTTFDDEEEVIYLDEYEYHVINAVTGERITEASDIN